MSNHKVNFGYWPWSIRTPSLTIEPLPRFRDILDEGLRGSEPCSTSCSCEGARP